MEFKTEKIVREIRFNDKKAPRVGKKQFSTIIVSDKLYKTWKKNNPEYENISIIEFRQIWGEIAKEVRNQTVNNSLGIYFPFYVGETKIQFIPPSVKAVDMAESSELGEKINHLNIITKGKIGKLVWQRKRAAAFNKMINLFAFVADRKFSKQSVKALNTNPELYRLMNQINKNYDKSRSDITSEEGNKRI